MDMQTKLENIQNDGMHQLVLKDGTIVRGNPEALEHGEDVFTFLIIVNGLLEEYTDDEIADVFPIHDDNVSGIWSDISQAPPLIIE